MVNEKTEQLNNEAVLLFSEGKIDEAEEKFKEVIALNSAYTTAINNLGMIYQQKEQYEKALKAFQQAIDLEEKDTYYINLGNTFIQLENYFEAIKSYKKATRLNPNNLIAWLNLAVSYQSIEEFENSIECWKTLISLERNPLYIIELSKLYIQLEQLSQAERLIKDLINNDNNHADAFFLLGLINLQKYNYGEAIQNFKQSLAIEPDNLQTRYHLAVSYISTNQLTEALNMFNLILKFTPNDLRVICDKGVILLSMNKEDEAMLEFDKCLTIDSNFEKALFYKALSIQEKDPLKAKKIFQKVIDLDAEYYEEAEKYINKLENSKEIGDVS